MTINRFETISKSRRLDGKRIVVTGCGYKPLNHTFYDIVTGEASHDPIFVEGQEMKLNIGSATAGVLALNGATVHMVSTSPEKLNNLTTGLEKVIAGGSFESSAVDLLSEQDVKRFVENLPGDKPIYWVQSIGLGAGAYKVKDDNPYLRLEDIPTELLEKESGIVLRGTHILMKELLPRLREQREARIAVVSSMSAVRGYGHGGSHCAAKGAISRYTNSAMLGLWKDNIFVTDIRPGGIDTGMYDCLSVQEAIKAISEEYDGIWSKQITLAPPTSVGEAINFVLTTPAQTTSLNLVAKGQFPHEGS